MEGKHGQIVQGPKGNKYLLYESESLVPHNDMMGGYSPPQHGTYLALSCYVMSKKVEIFVEMVALTSSHQKEK